MSGYSKFYPNFLPFNAHNQRHLMKRLLLLTFALVITGLSWAQTHLLSPEEFLGYKLGERFTRHHRIVEYFEHVAAASAQVKLEYYGETYENRPLLVAYLSSPENFAQLETLRQDNLKRAGLLPGAPAGPKVALVWLSYNVHGNESVSSEATMQTLYDLVNPQDTEKQNWLKHTVVIIDPCINPDGRDRYANFYNQYGNKRYNPDPQSKEHNEVWPGGRANHYLFDLNRDWAWQTQVESQQRMKLYNQWLPHVHVDFHEQGVNNPYYFAPAAEPLHKSITNWQREFQETIGRNHAKYFDKEGWLYFTKESFDLFYPSYGDTYPTYSGAIGMTYEKGGSGRAGLGVITEVGDTLTLTERILHHHTTGLSTVEVASRHAQRLVDEFATYFDDARNKPFGTYKTFVVKGDNNPQILEQLKEWLTKQDIRFGHTNAGKTYRAYNYLTGQMESMSVHPTDLILSVYQPKSTLLTVLFEPKSALSDSLTYDITAWSVPYSYGLKSYALTERITPNVEAKPMEYTGFQRVEGAYGYVARYQSITDLQWLGALLQEGVKVRVAKKDFAIEGQAYNKGSLIITRKDNLPLGSRLEGIIAHHADRLKKPVVAVRSGWVDAGKDFGSTSVALLNAPKVAVLAGNQVSSLSFGEIWHYFDQTIDYPLSVLDTDYFRRVRLDAYDVLIVPNGYYSLFDDKTLEEVSQWVNNGGRLVLIGNANGSFLDKNGFALKSEKKEENGEKKPPVEQKRFEEREKQAIMSDIQGAIFRVSMDNSHPLGFGFGKDYFTLKSGTTKYPYLENGWNVGVIESKKDARSGHVGSKVNMERSLVFGVQNKGRGQVVYMVDNPLFRAFWENGKFLFGNAVFLDF
jgi:hypothetical protein